MLCDARLAPSTASHPHYMTAGYATSEQIQGPPAASRRPATHSVEAVSSSNSPSSTDTQQQLIPSPSSVTRPTARQPPMIKKSYQPLVAGTGARGVNPCQHCATAQTVSSSGVRVSSECDLNQNGQRSMPRASADNCVQACPAVQASLPVQACPPLAACPSVQLPALQTDASSPAVNMQRMQNVASSAAGRVQMECHSQCLPVERVAVAMQNVRPSVARALSAQRRLPVEALPSPDDTPSSRSGSPPVTSRPRSNVQHHQYASEHVHLSTAPAAASQPDSTRLSGTVSNDGSTSRLDPVRFPSPAAVSEQTSRRLSHSSHVPMSAKCDESTSRHCAGSPLAASVMQCDQSTGQHCVKCGQSASRHCAGSPVMQCVESRPPFTPVALAGQPGGSSGNSEGVGFTSQAGGVQLPGPRSTAQQQPCVVYDTDRYSSSSHSLGRSVNDGQHPGGCQLHGSSTPAGPSPGRPRTVSDLLSTIPVLDVDWSVALPPPGGVGTVDGFVESVLGHNTASTDSGLQVNDSAVSSDARPQSLLDDNCNNVLYDCVTDRQDGIYQHRAENIEKRQELDVGPTLCEERLECVNDKPRIAEESSSSRDDGRPRLCSVAVNTSLYWPPRVDSSSQHNAAGATASTATLQNDVAFTAHVDNDSPPSVSRCQRPIISDRDMELVESGNMYDSMVDVSIGTPPLPVLPNPSEESVLSDMIMDMPEYTALSQDEK